MQSNVGRILPSCLLVVHIAALSFLFSASVYVSHIANKLCKLRDIFLQCSCQTFQCIDLILYEILFKF